MTTNPNYNFKSLRYQASETNAQDTAAEKLTVFELGESKTIDFVSLDGTRQNFPYIQYLTCWLGKDEKEWALKIFFSTHLVTIKGFCLERLYEAILEMKVKSVTAHDERYADMIDEDETFVSSIRVSWKKDSL